MSLFSSFGRGPKSEKMKTKAAVLTSLQKPLELMELEIPPLQEGQVLVRVHATGICGSQIGEIQGLKGPDRWLPHCLGHEAAGVVEDIGLGVQTVSKGDHVVLHWKKGHGVDSVNAKYKAQNCQVNAGQITTFQERTVVSENRITPISKTISWEIAALYGCCLTTGFGVVENDAGLKKSESILVMGVGGVGLAEIIAAKVVGASKIIAVDQYAPKLELAKFYGATHVVHAKNQDVRTEVDSIMNKEHLDVVLENTGHKHVIEMSYEMCGSQGRTILVGVPNCKEKVSIDTLPLHFGKVLTGSFGGNCIPSEDIPRIMKIIESHHVDLSKMVSNFYTLENINRAIDDLKNGVAIRPVVHMNGSHDIGYN